MAPGANAADFQSLGGVFDHGRASANVGIIDYIGCKRPMMEEIKNNDGLFTDIRYSF
ncbi:MAG: hypothetical protein IBX43_00710 [Campylobacterales bacterium]|nr:hypothetical protein [Campylobacterales bacterium]